MDTYNPFERGGSCQPGYSFYDFFLTHSFYLGHLPVLMKVAKAGGLVVEVFLKW